MFKGKVDLANGALRNQVILELIIHLISSTPCCTNSLCHLKGILIMNKHQLLVAHLNTVLHYLELTRPKIPDIEFVSKELQDFYIGCLTSLKTN